MGTSASASTSLARLFSIWATFSCSAAAAIARRPSARARATRVSASAWSACRRAPMLSPTSMSAMSIETISKAVWESSRRASTALEIRSGFSNTRLWLSAEPIALTIPSPTRAMIVSSVAPPISRCRLARTVTRALTFS